MPTYWGNSFRRDLPTLPTHQLQFEMLPMRISEEQVKAKLEMINVCKSVGSDGTP